MTIRADDSQEFTGHLTVPDSGTGPGIVLFQEIFGVNDFLHGKARDLAGLGYVVCCPDVFWRIERDVALPHDDIGLSRGMTLAGRYDQEVPDATKVADLTASFRHLRQQPEVTGRSGAMGYCFGGTLAYLLAVHGELDACVSYYGSGVADLLESAGGLDCPTLFHFGGRDTYIASGKVERVQQAFAGRPDVEVRVDPDAGHAFENLLAPAFANPAAAARSWPVTVDFLRRHLTLP